MPFEQFLKERIFNPLGMNDTDFHVPESKVAPASSEVVAPHGSAPASS